MHLCCSIKIIEKLKYQTKISQKKKKLKNYVMCIFKLSNKKKYLIFSNCIFNYYRFLSFSTNKKRKRKTNI